MMWRQGKGGLRVGVRAQACVLAAGLLCVTSVAFAGGLRAVDPGGLRQDLSRAQAVLSACEARAEACRPADLPADEQVRDSAVPGGSYFVHWVEERDNVDAAAKEQDDAKRRAALQPSEAELAGMAADLAVHRADQRGFARERRVATDVLARPEFQRVTGETWFDRMEARVFDFLSRIFGSFGRVSAQAPWLPVALEWLCFAGAAAGLIVIAQRALARQRLKVALGGGAIRAEEWAIAPAEWARDAERQAAAGDWREAIRCLYWASIVLLEDRRAWRHNPSRTPREYVRLLAAGSETQSRLRTLTGLFERVWYGLRDAAETDYRAARESFDGLQAEREPAAVEAR